MSANFVGIIVDGGASGDLKETNEPGAARAAVPLRLPPSGLAVFEFTESRYMFLLKTIFA